MIEKVVGYNNFYCEKGLSDVPHEILRSGNDGYFLIFDFSLDNCTIRSELERFRREPIIDVFESDYLIDSPHLELNRNEILYFKEIKIAYLKFFESENRFESLLAQKKTFKILNDGDVALYWPKNREDQIVLDPTWATDLLNLNEIGLTGYGVNVAVLDTGLYFKHPDFDGRTKIKSQYFVGKSARDNHGHGTFCTGILAGNRDHKDNRYGVAHECNLFVGKVLKKENGYTIDVLKGIFWALKNRCKVISISLEEPFAKSECIYQRAFQFALEKGSLCFVPAGNGSNRPKKPNALSVPGKCVNGVTVSAINRSKEIYYKSNRAHDGQKIDFIAPGEQVYSSIIPRKQHYYSYKSGTSMAVPYVAGLAALLWSHPYYQRDSPQKILEGLANNSKNLNSWLVQDAGNGVVLVPKNINQTNNKIMENSSKTTEQEKKAELISIVKISHNIDYQSIYASQLYGTFFAIYGKFHLKSEDENFYYLDSIDLSIVNYKGLFNILIKDYHFLPNTPNSNDSTLIIEVRALKGNEFQRVDCKGQRFRKDGSSYLHVDRRVAYLHSRGVALDSGVYDTEFFYREGVDFDVVPYGSNGRPNFVPEQKGRQNEPGLIGANTDPASAAGTKCPKSKNMIV